MGGSLRPSDVKLDSTFETLLIRSLFAEIRQIEEYIENVNLSKGKKAIQWDKFKLGGKLKGTIKNIVEKDIIVKLRNLGEENENQLSIIAPGPYHTVSSTHIHAVGDTIECRLLDVNKSKKICTVSLRHELVKSPE